MKTRLIIVGGFLVAGKTTKLWESARKLSIIGKKAGLITNDQAAELVDTAFLEYANGVVEEVSGSCFCCNFNGFSDAIMKIKDRGHELIIAEPVGSCTDLSATILQPLKEKFNENLTIAPLTVLVDPDRLSDIMGGGTSGLHHNAAYILRKQLEEADIILISKSDLLDSETLQELKQKTSETWPLAQVRIVSSKTGEGLDDWLNEVLSRSDSGTHITEVDYDAYAEGEAVLGWYNASFNLGGDEDWHGFLNTLISKLSSRFQRENAAVGHVKIMIQNSDQYSIANLTGINHTVTIRGNIKKSDNVKITINARVQMSPEDLEKEIEEEMQSICNHHIRFEKIASKCLSPGRPNPTFRYDHIVS